MRLKPSYICSSKGNQRLIKRRRSIRGHIVMCPYYRVSTKTLRTKQRFVIANRYLYRFAIRSFYNACFYYIQPITIGKVFS